MVDYFLVSSFVRRGDMRPWSVDRSEIEALREPNTGSWRKRRRYRCPGTGRRGVSPYDDMGGRSVAFVNSTVDDRSLEFIRSVPKVKRVDLRGTSIFDAGLEHLKGMTDLEQIWLSGTRITGAGLARLKNLVNLKSLLASQTRVDNGGLAHIRRAGGPGFARPRGRASRTRAWSISRS